MASVADAFGDDLEQIRKVRPPRLSRLLPRLSHCSRQYEGAQFDQIASSSAD
jgi:hypothetical protein